MKEDIVWSKKFELGIEDIDLQHHYFVGLINRLSSRIMKTNDKNLQRRLLSELIKYAHFHFVSEENIMYEMKYPELEEHMSLHVSLLNKLNMRVGMLQEDMEDATAIVEFLREWFVGHTLGEDKKLSQFMDCAASSP